MLFDRLYKSLTPLALALAFSACSDYIEEPTPEPVPGAPGTLTIQLSNTRGSRSKDSDNSETLIDNVIVCLYPSSSAENVQAVATGIFTDRNAHTNDKVTMYLTDEMISELFGNTDGASCKIYAVANYPAGTTLPDKPTISDLKTIPVTSTFSTVPVQPSFIMAGEGTVTYHAPAVTGTKGTADGSAALTRAAARIQLNLDLPESITVTNAAGEEETWIPEKDQTLRAMLNRGVATSVAYPVGTQNNPWKPGVAADYYDSDASEDASCRGFGQNLVPTTHPYGMVVPFYTYPNAWSESLLETNTTNITLRVRWGKLPNGATTPSEWVNYYYQVPVTPVGVNQIDRNYSYNINLTVGMLGSLLPETPTDIEGTYQIVNWSDQTVPVNIKDFRYLVVNPNVINIDNEAEIRIPFYSSHPIEELSDITMTFQRFNFFNDGNGDVVNITIPKKTIDASVSGDNKMVSYEVVNDGSQSYIKINHPLLIWTPVQANGTTEVSLTGQTKPSGNPTEQQIQTSVDNYINTNVSKFIPPTNEANAVPFSSYIFKIHIQHKDNAKYYEDITITQYPGMYIEADRNPGEGTSGNVYVNNYTNNTNGAYGGVWGLSTSSANQNPNMYLITISQFNETSNYYIGDPRMEYTSNQLTTQTSSGNRWNPTYSYPDLPTATANDNNAGSWSANATALYMAPTATGTTRRLTYYYPTIESQDDQYKMRVAPKFRVASSYGVTSTINRDDARRRVASYQECGCPAGRWRLPTYGELQFIVSLSSTQKIPLLFTIGNSYWTAQGLCTINNNGTITLNTSTSDSGNVKGVYDDWYWEQYPQYTISPNANGAYSFNWGDVPRPEKSN